MSAPVIDEKTVLHVAKLAQLALEPVEISLLQEQLTAILASMRSLDRFDVATLAPTLHAIEVQTPLRCDEVQPSASPEDFWHAAPAMIDGGFAVPKVLDGV